MARSIYKTKEGFVFQEFNQFVERLWNQAHDRKLSPEKRRRRLWDYHEAMSRYEDQESMLMKELGKELEKSREKFTFDK